MADDRTSRTKLLQELPETLRHLDITCPLCGMDTLKLMQLPRVRDAWEYRLHCQMCGVGVNIAIDHFEAMATASIVAVVQAKLEEALNRIMKAHPSPPAKKPAGMRLIERIKRWHAGVS